MFLFVSLVGVLGLLNLVLTLAVIRRLREHTEQLAVAGRMPPSKFTDIPLTVAPGTRIGEFATQTTDGRQLTRDDLADNGVVAFFSMFCDSCLAKVPAFVDFVKRVPEGSGRTLAVVIGMREQAESVIAQLEPVARVVVEPPEGAVSKAFAVTGFPTFCLLGPDQTLVSSTMELIELPEPAYV